ncbi:MAG: 3-mercaptopyruvate sulfurtransferase [Kordiimonadaceae bacterium]|nr:3-mercaptopyruvate sulfurtransferase [Kordiimonadaceae bacterium]
MQTSPLVTTDWLSAAISDGNGLSGDGRIILLDASWHMPGTGRSGEEEFTQGLIPGAVFFDIDAIVDETSDLPHTMPPAAQFEKHMSTLGISNDDTLVIYEKSPIPTAPRVWWMFRAMCHQKVFVLDGGFAKWQKEERPITTDRVSLEPSQYTASLNKRLFRSANQVAANIANKDEQVIDARATGRFNGTDAEPRAGVRSGHIPGSQNLPFSDLYQNGALKPAADLEKVIAAANIDLKTPLVASCGSGVTACNLAIALAVLGKWDTAIFDGSWSEWGADDTLPIEI